MRASIILVLALAAAPAAAQADVTVIYAEPAPPRPLVAVPVAPSADATPGEIEAPPPVVSSTMTATPTPSSAASAPTVSEPTSITPAAPTPSSAASAPTVSEPTSITPAAPTCVTPSPVRFIRTTDGSREPRLLHLTDCRGAPDAEALLELSILARPRVADRPDARDLAAHANDPELFASEVRRLDAGLLTRLQVIADRFPGHDIEITSGYRPDASETSRHRTGHALDVRVVDAPLDQVHAVALLLDESGVGLYPTSEFLHVDVRPRVTRWVDLAGPGEPANMVEVVNGRDGHASSAAPLAWPATPVDAPVASDSTVGPPPSRGTSGRRATRSRRARADTEEQQRAAVREALDALDALEGIDFQMP